MDKMTVLCVDDEPIVLDMLKQELKDESYDVVVASSGREGLKHMKAKRIAVVVADQWMPEMTGSEFLGQVRGLWPNIYRIMLTGDSDLDTMRKAVNEGRIHYYLCKPWTAEELKSAIRQGIEDLESKEARQRHVGEAQLADLVEHLPDGVCLLDGGRHLIMSNSVAEDYLSVLTDAAEGEDVVRIGKLSLEEILAPRGDGLAHEVEAEGPPPRFFKVEGRAIKSGESGGGWVLMIREVTEEREILERVQLQDRLAAVGQLAAGIAHDFNNMLSIIIGFAQILERKEYLQDRDRRNLERIISQGQRAAQLIGQVLDFSRKSVVQRRRMDLVPFLKEALKLLERTLPETIKMVAEFGPGDYIIEANLTQLQQVITNLAVNARDAMQEGGELRVGLSRVSVEPGESSLRKRGAYRIPQMEPGEWVLWTVSDQGAGMPAEVIEHIYEPFFTTKKPGEGTGLGLAQVYGIVKQHGGYIDVKSEIGKGTTFMIYIPQIAKAEPPPEETKVEVKSGSDETILVVEDEPEMQDVVKDMLENLNYRVLTADNGEDALNVFDAHRDEIALVLSDMVMPKMGGKELFETLTKRDPGVRMVAMTGYPLEEGREAKGLPQGLSGFLPKPLIIAKVAEVISQALEMKNDK